MFLPESMKNQIRRQIIETTKRIPDYSLCEVDNDLLDTLMFTTGYVIGRINPQDASEFKRLIYENDSVALDDFAQRKGILIEPFHSPFEVQKMIEEYGMDSMANNGFYFKIPVWTGSFLKKIDLSGISFENVIWDTSIISNNQMMIMLTDPNYMNMINTSDSVIKDFSDTNAQIDFSLSFQAKAFIGVNSVANCNFKGVDLTGAKTDFITNMRSVNVSDTGFVANLEEFEAIDCDLSGVNLSNHVIYFVQDENANLDPYRINNCVVRNTELNIIVDAMNQDISEDKKVEFFENVENGDFDGCVLRLKGPDYRTKKM